MNKFLVIGLSAQADLYYLLNHWHGISSFSSGKITFLILSPPHKWDGGQCQYWWWCSINHVWMANWNNTAQTIAQFRVASHWVLWFPTQRQDYQHTTGLLPIDSITLVVRWTFPRCPPGIDSSLQHLPILQVPAARLNTIYQHQWLLWAKWPGQCIIQPDLRL